MYVHVRVKTKQKKELIKELSEFRFEIHVKEEAKQNLANARIIEILKGQFKAQNIKLVSGHHAPTKLFSISED